MTNIERWTIGSTRLTSIVEAETSVPVTMLVPDAVDDDVRSAVTPTGCSSADGSHIGFRVQAFVLEQQDKVIVVDPCVGNHKSLELALWDHLDLPWLSDFRQAGFDPAAVDMVIHTHLHEDHIGWDTQLVDGQWVPVFVNATHVYVGDELDYTKRPDRREGQDPWADSVQPILDAGLSLETSPDADLGDGLRLLSTPGHTPGHVSLLVETGADELVITGDLIDHPFQCAAPHLSQGSDWKPTLARETRRSFLDHHTRAGSVVAGTHFPVSPVGRFETLESGWSFREVSADAG